MPKFLNNELIHLESEPKPKTTLQIFNSIAMEHLKEMQLDLNRQVFALHEWERRAKPSPRCDKYFMFNRMHEWTYERSKSRCWRCHGNGFCLDEDDYTERIATIDPCPECLGWGHGPSYMSRRCNRCHAYESMQSKVDTRWKEMIGRDG